MKLTLPLKTVNRTNTREHWGETAKRTKRERNSVALLLKPRLAELGSTRLVVLLARSGPNELDDDGLRAALKGVRDGVAAALRIDDASPLVEWRYAQAKGEHGVEVLVFWDDAEPWNLPREAYAIPALPIDTAADERMGQLLKARREEMPQAQRIRLRAKPATYRSNT